MHCDEYHISSFVVHGRQSAIGAIRQAVEAIPGAEVHGAGPTGKMVVTLEASNEQDILLRMDEINLIDGVMSVALVYHQVDSHPSRNGEGAP